jgi:hypothetical protein
MSAGDAGEHDAGRLIVSLQRKTDRAAQTGIALCKSHLVGDIADGGKKIGLLGALLGLLDPFFQFIDPLQQHIGIGRLNRCTTQYRECSTSTECGFFHAI